MYIPYVHRLAAPPCGGVRGLSRHCRSASRRPARRPIPRPRRPAHARHRTARRREGKCGHRVFPPPRRRSRQRRRIGRHGPHVTAPEIELHARLRQKTLPENTVGLASQHLLQGKDRRHLTLPAQCVDGECEFLQQYAHRRDQDSRTADHTPAARPAQRRSARAIANRHRAPSHPYRRPDAPGSNRRPSHRNRGVPGGNGMRPHLRAAVPDPVVRQNAAPLRRRRLPATGTPGHTTASVSNSVRDRCILFAFFILLFWLPATEPPSGRARGLAANFPVRQPVPPCN